MTDLSDLITRALIEARYVASAALIAVVISGACGMGEARQLRCAGVAALLAVVVKIGRRLRARQPT